MIMFLPVQPRARRIAVMAASVPELVILTRSIEGMASRISRAISVSAVVGAPKLVPLRAASQTAAITSGWACPRIIGPQERT